MRQSQQNGTLLHGLLKTLQAVLFEKTDNDRLRLLSDCPKWLKDLAGYSLTQSQEWSVSDDSSFLFHFVTEAEEVWSGRKKGSLSSGLWVETDTRGEEHHLEARAFVVQNSKILLLQEVTSIFNEQQPLFQKARESLLNHQKLVKEVQEKEILLHCIVHDLGGPLMGIDSIFALLSRESLSTSGRRRLQTGRKASAVVQELKSDILNVFSAELELSSGTLGNPNEAPDLMKCARTVVETMTPAGLLKQVDIVLEISPGDQERDWKVSGEETRLERVFYNLLENALRHSPENSRIELSLKPVGSKFEVSVEDEGPGVAPEHVSGLFKKFFRGGEAAGKAGLGLYFCKIMIERWGGRIEYVPRSPRGSRFWFQLPRAFPEAPNGTSSVQS